MLMNNFWPTLHKPFFALAPMEDVTDTVFRELIAGISSPGKLHVLFTEFMSVDGFLHVKGNEKVRHRLLISEGERALLAEKGMKIVAQVWGSDPEKFYRTGKDIARDYSFDGIDINMGCPVSKIVKHNSCSALIKMPELAKEIITATREGSGLPVSVKTRIGFNEIVTEEWISNILEVKPAAITVHGRTQKMQSEGLADWNEIGKAVKLRDQSGSGTVMLGNGDVLSHEDGIQRSREFGVEGIMVGRGIFYNPAFFASREEKDPKERISLLYSHLSRFREVWTGQKNFSILKRFFKIYVHSFDGAGELRSLLMDTNSCEEAIRTLDLYLDR